MAKIFFNSLLDKTECDKFYDVEPARNQKNDTYLKYGCSVPVSQERMGCDQYSAGPVDLIQIGWEEALWAEGGRPQRPRHENGIRSFQVCPS